MIQFNLREVGMGRIKDLVVEKLEERVEGEVVENLQDIISDVYVFGAHNTRESDVFLSPDLPDVERIAVFLERQGISTSVERIGNPAPRHWIALRRRFRMNSPEQCARVSILVWLDINNLVSW